MSKKRDMQAELIELCMTDPVKARAQVDAALVVLSVVEKAAAAHKAAKTTRPAAAAAEPAPAPKPRAAAAPKDPAPAKGRIVEPATDGSLPGLATEGASSAPN